MTFTAIFIVVMLLVCVYNAMRLAYLPQRDVPFWAKLLVYGSVPVQFLLLFNTIREGY